MFLSSKRTNFEDEETEAERQLKARNKKKDAMMRGLTSEFDMVINREQVFNEAMTSFSQTEHHLTTKEILSKNNTLKEQGFKGILDDIHFDNINKLENIRKATSAKHSVIRNILKSDATDVSVHYEKLILIESALDRVRKKLDLEEIEAEQILSKTEKLKNDKLVLAYNIENIKHNIHFMDSLIEKEGNLKDPRYTELFRKVQSTGVEVEMERMTKDMIVSRLEKELSKISYERIQAASQITDWMIEIEEGTHMLENMKRQRDMAEIETSSLVAKIKTEFKSLEILNSFVFLSQFIDTKLYKINPAARSNTRIDSLRSSEIKDITSIEQVFGKDSRRTLKSLKRLSTTKEDESMPESARGDINSPLKYNPKSFKRTKTNITKNKLLSMEEVHGILQDSHLHEGIEVFFGDYEGGMTAFIDLIISSYAYLNDTGKVVQSQLDALIAKFKDKSEEFYSLEKELQVRKVIIERYQSYSKVILYKGGSVDQSFIEDFNGIVNEDNISQETNLINIDPSLIRIDPNRQRQQIISDRDPYIYRRLDTDKSMTRYSIIYFI